MFVAALNATPMTIDMATPPFIFGVIVGLVIALAIRRSRLRARGSVVTFIDGAIPELGAAFNPALRYDIFCCGEGLAAAWTEEFKDVAILGYIGEPRVEPRLRTHMHGRWLALSLRDGRRVYVLPRSIKRIAQASAQTPNDLMQQQ